MENKWAAGRLWIPCLSSAEVDDLMNTTFSASRQVLGDAIHLWDNALVISDRTDTPVALGDGEIFFQAAEGYTLSDDDV